MTFPPFKTVWDAADRLKQNQATVEDTYLLRDYMLSQWHMTDRIERQRNEIARLHEERQRAWAATGDKTVWSRLPDGQSIIIVFRERTVVGYILFPRARGDHYYWKCGQIDGRESGITAALGAISRAYQKRAGVSVSVQDSLIWNDTLDRVVRDSPSTETNLLVHQYQVAVRAAVAEPVDLTLPQGDGDSFGYTPAENPLCPLEQLASDFIRAFPQVNHAVAHVAISALYCLTRERGEQWSTGWVSSYASGLKLGWQFP